MTRFLAPSNCCPGPRPIGDLVGGISSANPDFTFGVLQGEGKQLQARDQGYWVRRLLICLFLFLLKTLPVFPWCWLFLKLVSFTGWSSAWDWSKVHTLVGFVGRCGIQALSKIRSYFWLLSRFSGDFPPWWLLPACLRRQGLSTTS